jgi:anti-sigma-K factor RskA
MSELSPLSENERDEIVAYLDGELKGESARKVENRIAREPAVRAEVDALRRAWDMLDFLPMPEPSVQFTHRTLEKLSPLTAPSPDEDRPRRPWVRLAVAAGWAAAVVAALATGYAVTRTRTPREPGEQELVRDLRVIENLRQYEAVEDLDFVRELDAPDLFGEDSVGT